MNSVALTTGVSSRSTWVARLRLGSSTAATTTALLRTAALSQKPEFIASTPDAGLLLLIIGQSLIACRGSMIRFSETVAGSVRIDRGWVDVSGWRRR
jgi:hypothetical protein